MTGQARQRVLSRALKALVRGSPFPGEPPGNKFQQTAHQSCGSPARASLTRSDSTLDAGQSNAVEMLGRMQAHDKVGVFAYIGQRFLKWIARRGGGPR